MRFDRDKLKPPGYNTYVSNGQRIIVTNQLTLMLESHPLGSFWCEVGLSQRLIRSGCRSQMRPVFGWKIVKGEQTFLVLLQEVNRFGIFRLVTGDKLIIGRFSGFTGSVAALSFSSMPR
jgi:hypothetical protein